MCALAPAENEEQKAPRKWRCVGGTTIGEYGVTYRDAGHSRLSLGVGAEQLGRLKRQRDLVHEAREEPVGTAHDRVLLVDCSRDFQRACGDDRGKRGIAAKADHRAWLDLLKQTPRSEKA